MLNFFGEILTNDEDIRITLGTCQVMPWKMTRDTRQNQKITKGSFEKMLGNVKKMSGHDRKR
jgi:hypothetical protein